MFDGIFETIATTYKKMDSVAFEVGSISISVVDIINGALALIFLYFAVKIIFKYLTKRLEKSVRYSKAQKILYLKLMHVVLVAVAVLIFLNVLGINLTTLAIFTSAVGLGVGLGLQKIVSNFISGIIVLMDKSIKPGDVIAIGDTYGQVIDLGARYISVLTRDGKAHLIPNDLLMTEKVENWSYDNNLLRLRIPIGVAYKSDIHLVQKLLVEAAKLHPRVVSEPNPRALIREFGGSQINFELRVWIKDPASGIRRPQSEIYFLIWDKFKEHNIEIPSPQLEVRMINGQKN